MIRVTEQSRNFMNYNGDVCFRTILNICSDLQTSKRYHTNNDNHTTYNQF